MKLLKNQAGFTKVEVVLVILVIGLLGAGGWFVYDRTKNGSSPTTNSKPEITNFAECVSAGNPVMESYPEQCAADGKTFTNTARAAGADETQNWLLFSPSDKAYSVRVPDGWKGVALNNNLYVRDVQKLVYTPGTKAIVEVMTEGGWDGASPFALYNPGSYADQIVREGSEVATVKTSDGITAAKYVFTQTTEPDGIGYQKGDKVYNYYFDKDGKYLQVSHVVSTGQADQSELVERMIKTIKF